ncbi:MAG: tetratricopeptide repeat protein [Acidobacteria bacterium]|nr:tetratricopeptide repeat protein [Acidobacteriota bacterium]
MKGHWTSHILAEILRDLYFEERSGSLSLIHGDESWVLHFDRGMLQFAHGCRPEDHLLTVLREQELVETSALEEVQAQLASPTDLPQALIHQGLLDKSTLDAPIRTIVRRGVESVFSWSEGLYQFKEGWLLKDVFDSNVLFTFETILKGIAKMADFDPVQEVLLSLDKPISINPSIFLPVEKLGLTSSEGFVLSRVDGNTAIRDIVSILPPDMEEATYRFLYGVLVLGMVQFDAKESGTRLFSLRDLVDKHRAFEETARNERMRIREAYLIIRSQAPHEVLGVPMQAGPEEIKSAYERRRQEFDPASFLPKVQKELKEELQIIESRLVEAFLGMKEIQMKGLREAVERKSAGRSESVNLGDFALRRELNKTQRQTSEEEREGRGQHYYKLAVGAMRQMQYHDALIYAQEALRHDPQAEYHALLGNIQVRNPDKRWQRQAEDNYLKSIDLDSWNPDYRVCLARLYRIQGRRNKAKKVLEKALEITPNHEEGLAEMREIESAEAPEPQPQG